MDDDGLENLGRIKVYPIQINSTEDFARKFGRVTNLSMSLGHRPEDENPVLSKGEARHQSRRGASLFKAVLESAKRFTSGLEDVFQRRKRNST